MLSVPSIIVLLIMFVGLYAFVQFIGEEGQYRKATYYKTLPLWITRLNRRERKLYALLREVRGEGMYSQMIWKVCRYGSLSEFRTLLNDLKNQQSQAPNPMKAIIGKKACTLLVNNRTHPFRFIRTRLHHLFHSIKSFSFLRKATFKKAL